MNLVDELITFHNINQQTQDVESMLVQRHFPISLLTQFLIIHMKKYTLLYKCRGPTLKFSGEITHRKFL